MARTMRQENTHLVVCLRIVRRLGLRLFQHFHGLITFPLGMAQQPRKAMVVGGRPGVVEHQGIVVRYGSLLLIGHIALLQNGGPQR